MIFEIVNYQSSVMMARSKHIKINKFEEKSGTKNLTNIKIVIIFLNISM